MRITAATAGEQATLDVTEPAVEPTGAGLISATKLAGATLTDKADRLAAGQGLTLPPGIFSAPDFGRPAEIYPAYCHFLAKPAKVLGSGRDVTTLQIDPVSFTQPLHAFDPVKYPLLETLPDNTSNNFYYLARFDKASEVAGITFLGTDQQVNPKTGRPYFFNGISLYGPQARHLHDCSIVGMPGGKSIPPDETFALQAYKVAGEFRLTDVLVDGLGKGSSAITWTTGDPNLDVVYDRVTVRGCPNGSGFTQFNQTCRSITFTDVAVDGCTGGANFEQIRAANGIKFVRPDIRNSRGSSGGPAYHLSIESNAYSNRVDIYDPVGITPANRWKVRISLTYGYSIFVPQGPQAQRGADIHLWVGGVERPDLIEWVRTKGAA
ncbi:hypothetical protein [uncultured Friedmanniella sp.]|uniref:hypothetical protein n=1 Tax=uncultured Friedmanniella sp. TaxID=335381 RepID=UPI0035CA8EAC